MTTDSLTQTTSAGLGGARSWLDNQLARSQSLRKSTLLLTHVFGTLVMLSAPLTLVVAGTASIRLYSGITGPLDWFFVEALTALTILSAFLSWQLLMVRPRHEHGVEISDAQAPELFSMLQRRVAHFKMKPVARIVLTTQARLEVTAEPVLPIPFLHRYTLDAGLPLLFFLGRDEFRLALAGTIAASAGRQSSLEGWLTQAASDWKPIIEALEAQRTLLSRLLLKPMRRVSRLSDELCADFSTDWRLEQSLWMHSNSEEHSVNDYLSIQVVTEAYLDQQYWPMVLKAAERSPVPVVKAFSHLPVLLSKTFDNSLAERWLAQAQLSGNARHGHLRDLLAELRIEHLSWPGMPEQTAFDALFTSRSALKQMDAFWQEEIEAEWQSRHARYQADRARFENLHKRAMEQGLRGESALRYIKLVDRFLEADAVQNAHRSMFRYNKDDARVCFASGLALMRCGDGSWGSDALQRAAALEPALAKRAHALINEHKRAWLREDPDDQATAQQATA